jgi:hypothetical protein
MRPRSPRGRRALLPVAIIGMVLALAGTAAAIVLRAGDIVIHAEGGFSPTTLPKHENAPITLQGGGELSTVSGDLPPVLKTLTIEYDRHGAVETRGLPVCVAGKLQATDTEAARRACPGAIVGKGLGRAIVAFPESKPIPISSPLTLFNGPEVHGRPTVLAHAFTTVPVPATFVIPIVIERIHKGVYGYRTEAKIPKIAGGSGIPIAGHLKIGRRWTYKGHRYSYLSARCETGKLQARGEFEFDDATFLSGTFVKGCKGLD